MDDRALPRQKLTCVRVFQSISATKKKPPQRREMNARVKTYPTKPIIESYISSRPPM